MNGWKTVAVSVATVLLGVLESQHITSLVAEHPGGFAVGVSVVIFVLRWMTTTPIFKS